MPPSEPADAGDARGPLIEWYSTENSDFQDASKLLEFTDILREVRRQPGCVAIAKQDPIESSVPRFFAIGGLHVQNHPPDGAKIDSFTEWRDAEHRTQFLKSKISARLTEVIEQNQVQREFLVRLLHKPGTRVIRAYPIDSHNPYEILTVYFPTSLSDAAIQALDRIQGPHHLGGPMSGQEIQHPLSYPSEGLLARHHGWADGVVEYQGKPARRMVYIFKWLDQLAQRRYREEETFLKRTRDGRTLENATEVFVDDLEELGMLGSESKTTNFLEILGFYLPNDPGYIQGVNDFATFRQQPC